MKNGWRCLAKPERVLSEPMASNAELFLQKVKVNEHLMPLIGSIPYWEQTSVIGFKQNGEEVGQVYACWQELEGYPYLRSLMAHPLNSGFGSRVLDGYCKLADRLNVAIVLEPFKPRNRKYFKRFGFDKWKGHPYWMIRHPIS